MLNDRVVTAAMAVAARGGEPPETVRCRVESYIDEIVPAFSLGAYYQLGMPLARAAIHLFYRPVIDDAALRKLAALPEGVTQVFVLNHRSNFDYVVAGWALARRVAISYAVGEWARVFPLDVLFKAFGGFFVRRGFPDPVYHVVLRRYLQLIARRGVTQGIFLEGGLTRDGALRPPKVGLLDALVELAAEGQQLVFVPVGINYDRVLEDETLLAEKRGQAAPPTFAQKIIGVLRFLFGLPIWMAMNTMRALTGRLHHAGTVAVAFGAPLSLDDAAASLGLSLAALQKADDDTRRNASKCLATELMTRIANVIPATPVPLVAHAIDAAGGDLSEAALVQRVQEIRRTLEERGVPITPGVELDSLRTSRDTLDENRSRETALLEGELVGIEESETIVRLGVERLVRRRILRRNGDRIVLEDSQRARELIAYYKRSISS